MTVLRVFFVDQKRKGIETAKGCDIVDVFMFSSSSLYALYRCHVMKQR